MINNAIIKGVASYHPDNVVDNEFFIDYFDNKNVDIRGLLKVTGRDKRYISNDENETTLTMAIEAAREVLSRTLVKPSQIDSVVVASGTPEYISPTNALKVHAALGISSSASVYDMNANCIGMIVAMERVSRVMKSDKYMKYALVIGSDQLSKYVNYDDSFTYPNFADAASAVILENIYNTDRGFIDSDFYTNSSNHDNVLFPYRGESATIHDKSLRTKDKLLQWKPFTSKGAFHSAKISIEQLLWRNSLEKKDIKYYFVSQFAKRSIEEICEDLGENMDKFIFIGDEYGYTGASSPFLAYERAVSEGKLHIGDYVIFWSVGAGTVCSCILYKY